MWKIMMKVTVINGCMLFLLLSFTIVQSRNAPTSAHNKLYWYEKNRQLLLNRMRNVQPEHLPRVKNVIIFVGDGMGMTTITAARVLKRQNLKNPNAQLSFDEFPATALIQTDIANSQIPESAATATALFCGVKTNFENLGVDASTGKYACENKESHTPSIIAWAQDKNLKTGFVTTSRVTHATPAALYAHSRRHFEDDSKQEDEACKDIAKQLFKDKPGRDLNVIFGGGLSRLTPEGEDEGVRKDGKDLIKKWKELHPFGKYVTSRKEMLEVDEKVEHLLGIFAQNHMKFNADRNGTLEPSLAEMTLRAIKLLKRKNPRGFLLMVEGAKIDLAHHYNNAYRALDDTLAFDDAVRIAIENTDLLETLIIVTADHASSMIYSGFAAPKNYSVIGMDKYVSNVDSKPYQLLTYSSGIGNTNYSEASSLRDPKNAIHKAAIPATWANHAASDVPLYSVGPMANLLFSGTFDQTYVPHAIAYAMCLSQYSERCDEAYVQRLKPLNERKPGGIEELQKVLYKESKKFQHSIEDVEKRIKEEMNERQTTSKNLWVITDSYESSDLIANFTRSEIENHAYKIRLNYLCFVAIILVAINKILWI